MNLPPKGEINGINFIEILKDASQSALTGMIRLENQAIVKVVYIQKGIVSFASSNEKTDRLTEVLKRARKLTPEQVEDAQARLKPNVSIGKTLVELGYISARDLLWGARAQVDSILHQMLFWTEGRYQIQEGTLPKEIIHLNLAIPSIIFDGIMKTQNREWILQHIGSPDAIYQLANDFHKQNETLQLPVNEIASHLNGKRSLHDIAEKSEMDTFEICKTVVGLECLGLAHAIQDTPLQMDLSTPETEQPHEVEIAENAEIPMRDFEEPVETVATVETAPPANEEEPEKKAEQVVPVETIVQPEPVQVEPQLAMDKIILIPQDEPEVQPRRQWKTPVTAILLIIAIALLIFMYLQHQQANPVPASQEPPKPSPTKSESVNAAKLPAATPSTAQPLQSKPATTPELPDNSPLHMLQDGKISDAAQSWRTQLSKHNFGYTIQLVIACQDKTVLDTYRLLNYSKEIIVLPLNFKGQNCYRVLYGQFRARENAQSAVRSLPEVFSKQPSPPTVIGFSKIL